MPTAMEHSLALMKAVGPLGALRLLVSRALGIERSLRVEVDGRALDVRPADSDLFVVAQVFGSGEYRLPQNVIRGLSLHVSDVLKRSGKPIVVDAGSNIGCSTLFFSTLFTDARIISIEPDADAYRIAKRHCAGVPNIDLLFGALWSDVSWERLPSPALQGSFDQKVRHRTGAKIRRHVRMCGTRSVHTNRR